MQGAEKIHFFIGMLCIIINLFSSELCSSDKPCDCVNEDCVAPWWVLDDQRNCRTDQVSYQ